MNVINLAPSILLEEIKSYAILLELSILLLTMRIYQTGNHGQAH